MSIPNMIDDNSLFDNITRKYLGPSKYSEPEFTYLNNSARPEVETIRALLETWFSRYSKIKATDLRARFRSKDDLNHRSAFFELFIHELILKLGFAPQIHPELPSKKSKHPDFLIESPKETFYIEAVTTSNESANERAKRAIMDAIYDSINRLDSPNFFIGMEIKRSPKKPHPAKPIKSFLVKKLKNLNPDEMEVLLKNGIDVLPHWLYTYEDLEIEFFPIPKSDKNRGKTGVRPIGFQFSGMHAIDSRTSIRDALCAKAGRYGNLKVPYIVAINVLDSSTDFTDIMEALFGQEKYVIDLSIPKQSEPKMVRELDGVWTSKSGPRYTRLSAVLLTVNVSPWNIPRGNIRLYHNPWAIHPYSSELTTLPQAVPIEGKMDLRDGRPLSSIFGIPLEWPIFKW
jgi:hypothetical protein